MEITFLNFKQKLTRCLKEELEIMKLSDKISSFDLGIHPWHGYIEFSFLTTRELDKDEEIKFEIGDWEHYNFNEFQENENKPIFKIGQWMKQKWEEDETYSTTFFIMASEILKEHINLFNKFNCDENFHLSVYHPDDSDFKNYLDE